jgi:hypothetical protein
MKPVDQNYVELAQKYYEQAWAAADRAEVPAINMAP